MKTKNLYLNIGLLICNTLVISMLYHTTPYFGIGFKYKHSSRFCKSSCCYWLRPLVAGFFVLNPLNP